MKQSKLERVIKGGKEISEFETAEKAGQQRLFGEDANATPRHTTSCLTACCLKLTYYKLSHGVLLEVDILNREDVEATSCDCHQVIKDESARFLGN